MGADDERADAGVGDCLEPEKGLAAAGGENDATSTVVVTPHIEGGLLVVAGFDPESGFEREVGIGAGGIFEFTVARGGAGELLLDGGLVTCSIALVGAVGISVVAPCTSPFEKRTIAVGLSAILVDAVVPLRIRNSIGSVGEQKRAAVELDPHCIWWSEGREWNKRYYCVAFRSFVTTIHSWAVNITLGVQRERRRTCPFGTRIKRRAFRTMDLSTDDLRNLCTSDVFDRAVTYHEEGRVGKVDRFGTTVTADVQGSQPSPYSVEITFEDVGGAAVETVGASCTCPYDWGGHCKHIIAVLLTITEGDVDLEDEKAKTEQLLQDVHPDALRGFLLAEFERNAEARRRFLVHFEEQDTRSFSDYKQEMARQYRGPHMYRYEGPDFSEFHDLAASHRRQGHPLEAATIFRAMTEVRIENMDMVADYYAEDFDSELDAFVECLQEATLAHEDKREYTEYLFERWMSDNPAVETFAGQYEDALWDFCTKADLQHWRELLEGQLPTAIPEKGGINEESGLIETTGHYKAKYEFETYADILDALDDTDTLHEVYEHHYLDISSFCLQYARQLAEQGDTTQAIEVAEEGLDEFPNNTGLRTFLTEVYADTDPEKHRTHLRELFLQTGKWEYYEELQSLCSEEEWEGIVADFETEFEESNVHRLIQLYLREGRTEEAFETVVTAARGETGDAFRRMASDNGLSVLSQYHDDVAAYDAEMYYEIYKELLEPFLADTTGRDHYQTVVDYLEEMRDLGFEERFERFVEYLKNKHSNRPAFLDELGAIEDA